MKTHPPPFLNRKTLINVINKSRGGKKHINAEDTY